MVKDIWDTVFYTKSSRKKKINTVLNNTWKDVSIVFEDIFDPHNVLASFRNCDAFGVRDIHLVFSKQKRFNPLLLGKKSSASANKWLHYTIWNSSKECISYLKENKKKIYATSLHRDSKNIWDVSLSLKDIAIVFGNEKTGITDYVLKNSDILLKIPMFGFVQSLNLSVSVGIILYELNKQRRVYY